jgi:hypothetical protein
VSKFLLNILVEILKILPKFPKSLKFKNIFSFEFPLGVPPSQLSFTVPAHIFRRSLFPSTLRLAPLAEQWDGVGKATMAEPIRHKRGLLGGCDAHAGGETSVGTLQAR